MNDLYGKVIHCKNIEEMEALLKEIAHVYVTASYIWNYNGNDGLRRDCVHIGKTGNFAGFSSKKYYEEKNFIITEFSDLENNKDNDYNRGLNDAWNLAKQIILTELDGGMSGKDFFNIFQGYDSTRLVFKNLPVEKVLSRFNTYYEKEQLHVNDEIILRGLLKGIITYLHSDGTVDILLSNGLTARREKPEDLEKTGRVIDISNLLSEIDNSNTEEYERDE